MILDILFHNAPPMQIQNIRMTSIYPKVDLISEPVLIVYYKDYSKGPYRIPLEVIKNITTTND